MPDTEGWAQSSTANLAGKTAEGTLNKLPNLSAGIFVPAEHVRSGIDDQQLCLKFECGLADLLVERHQHTAAIAAEGHHDVVMTKSRKPADIAETGEPAAVQAIDVFLTPLQLVEVVLTVPRARSGPAVSMSSHGWPMAAAVPASAPTGTCRHRHRHKMRSHNRRESNHGRPSGAQVPISLKTGRVDQYERAVRVAPVRPCARDQACSISIARRRSWRQSRRGSARRNSRQGQRHGLQQNLDVRPAATDPMADQAQQIVVPAITGEDRCDQLVGVHAFEFAPDIEAGCRLFGSVRRKGRLESSHTVGWPVCERNTSVRSRPGRPLPATQRATQPHDPRRISDRRVAAERLLQSAQSCLHRPPRRPARPGATIVGRAGAALCR